MLTPAIVRSSTALLVALDALFAWNHEGACVCRKPRPEPRAHGREAVVGSWEEIGWRSSFARRARP